jgi:hypothetical protein
MPLLYNIRQYFSDYFYPCHEFNSHPGPSDLSDFEEDNVPAKISNRVKVARNPARILQTFKPGIA